MERGIITITENGAVTMPTAPVWMTQQEMSDAFNVFGCYIRKAIASIYKNNELSEEETVRHVRQDGRIAMTCTALKWWLPWLSGYEAGKAWLSESSSWKGCTQQAVKSL